ncbi:membrane or secreted protein [Flagellimonas sp. HMM57]|uniref:membrane or secreted protein n=1 Tax=unclassified Flagellimonas TaxID=2644544 RepID=UPI0013D4C4E8|nr:MULTISPECIES: membrane or secreted protein [unclassified Flagellimonas]UII77890.1 membrane or secreted protein [Flagellimonas sp. HMM57]
MGRYFLLLLIGILGVSANAQTLIGAWENTSFSSEGNSLKNILIISEAYYASTWFNTKTGAFVSTDGGQWALKGDEITHTIEFDSGDLEHIGAIVSFRIELPQDKLKIKGNDSAWTRIDDGSPGTLAGAWLMSGRKRNGEFQTRDTDRPRKTMKILSGTRFQWIAYNTETKEFMGTGGGSYTTVNGKYTENIEFFSRDDSRVGASLQFDYSVKDGDWHHSGFSSKGDPLYEVWSIRNQ